MSTEIASTLARLAPAIDFLARRRMLQPLLLALTIHQPLAFVIGQGLWLCSPFEFLLPASGLGDWARLLSHPAGGPALNRLLEDAWDASTMLVEQPQ